jgi:hypothetical protein
MFWKCCTQYLERVVVLEVLYTVFGEGSCSGSVVHSNLSSLLFWKCRAQKLEQVVL